MLVRTLIPTKRGRSFLDQIQQMLTNYQLFPNFYNCMDYGLAQTRQRFIIVGKCEDVETTFTIPEPFNTPPLTIRDVIGDLPEPPQDLLLDRLNLVN